VIRRGVWLGLLTTWAAAAPAVAFAQVRCDVSVQSHAQDGPRNWGAPLNRTVTLHAGKVDLRTALERLANAAKIRLSYSADLLPLKQERCATYDSALVGDVLVDLLAGSTVEAVGQRGDVVLAPAPAARASRSVNDEAVVTLPPVVVGARPSRLRRAHLQRQWM
jgi:hypothetical protein